MIGLGKRSAIIAPDCDIMTLAPEIGHLGDCCATPGQDGSHPKNTYNIMAVARWSIVDDEKNHANGTHVDKWNTQKKLFGHVAAVRKIIPCVYAAVSAGRMSGER